MRKLDRYIEEYNLLCDNNLDSPKKLLNFQENLSARNFYRNPRKRKHCYWHGTRNNAVS